VRDLGAVEFWPDYSGALLHVAGTPVKLTEYPVPADVAIRAAAWVTRYDDSKLPFGDRPDADWMAEGRALFAILRECLAAEDITLIDWEGIWEVPPSSKS
jgi:hypothetical protein